MPVHPSREAQIGSLNAEKAPVAVLAVYSDYVGTLSTESAAELPEHIDIKDHAVDLVDSKQPPYGPIYSLGPELETLKTYIEKSLASGFIKHFKSPAGALILSVCKSNGSLRLCVDY